MKPKNNPKSTPTRPAAAKAPAKPAKQEPVLELNELKKPWFNKWFQASFITLLAWALYVYTWNGEYALDDLIVITGNKFTQQGFAGIKNLLFKDSFLGYTGMENQLAGGRYRPLSIVTFAIEFEFWGKNPATKAWLPHFSHCVNILLYGILSWQLFWFLDKRIFRNSPWAAFLASLIFVAHPIHTEIVGNIKSRDELMALSFMLLSMEHFFRWFLDKRSGYWVASAMFFYFLSLVSKENGLVYFVIVPLIVYVWHGKTRAEAFKSGLYFFGLIVFYVILRAKLTGLNANVQNGEVLNAPYLYAKPLQAFATKTMLLSKFIVMLIIPYGIKFLGTANMSYDYSFDQIKYIWPSDPRFMLSLVLNVGLIVYALKNIMKRSVPAFCILFYFSGISLVCNFFFDVGTAFADRFMFQPSLGMAIWIAWAADKYLFKDREYYPRFTKVNAATLVWLIPACWLTHERNYDWLNEYNLFSKDVITCPYSAKTHSNCGVVLINQSAKAEFKPVQKDSILRKAIWHLHHALEIHPGFIDAWANLGVAYSRKELMDSSEYAWTQGQMRSPAHPKIMETMKLLPDMFFYQGYKYNQAKQFKLSAIAYQKAIKYHYKDSAEAYYNAGGNLLMAGDANSARDAWLKSVQINPAHKASREWLTRIGIQLAPLQPNPTPAKKTQEFKL